MLPLAILALLAPLAAAHMEMTAPPPLRSKHNEHADQAQVDYSMTSPLEASGSNFPCKGYLKDTTGKDSVASWQAGSSQQVTLEGSAIHEGGSCQLSISEDEGATFKVIKSFIGNCPASTGPVTLDVDIPKDAKDGDVVFAWTWNNRVGNREFYMNCAIVTIEGGGAGLASYPDMFVAQLSDINSCTVPEGVDVDYPAPGDQVERADGDDAIGAPAGDCGAAGGSGGGSTSASGSAPATSASAPATSASAPATSGGASASVSASVSVSAPVSASTSAPATSAPESASGSAPATESTPASGSASASASGSPSASESAPASGSASATESAPASSSVPTSAPASSSAPTSAPASGSATSTGPASGTATSSAPASSSSTGGDSCTEGAIRCDSASSWSQCGSGAWQSEGAVPGGMTCKDGAIVPAGARRRAVSAHKRHWGSRGQV